MADSEALKAALRRIGEDLFAIEINTIIKPTMTAARFPGAAHGLLDIAAEYDRFLAQCTSAHDAGTAVSRRINETYFDGLRTTAKALLTTGFPNETPMKRRLVARIQDNSDQIKAILARNGYAAIPTHPTLPPAPQPAGEPHPRAFTRDDANVAERNPVKVVFKDLPSADLVAIRKVWEIGLEEIAMQTVVHLDGDVVTRLQPEYASGGAPGIVALHDRATTVALSYWKDLVGIAREVVKAAIGLAPGG